MHFDFLTCTWFNFSVQLETLGPILWKITWKRLPSRFHGNIYQPGKNRILARVIDHPGENILFLPKGKGKNKILTRLEVKKFLPAGRKKILARAAVGRKGKNFFTFPRVRMFYFTFRRVRILFFPAPLGKNSILVNLTNKPTLSGLICVKLPFFKWLH